MDTSDGVAGTATGMLPSGTVTFAFTDIEGSTTLLQRLGADYEDVLSGYRRILRDALARHSGVEVDTEGDGFFCVFSSARDAVMAAVEVQRELAAGEWPDGAEVRARMGMHTGEATLTETGYVGIDVHRAARIVGSASGGQVVLSEATRAVAGALEDLQYRDLGAHRLRDLGQPEHLYQLVAPGLDAQFPPLRTLDAVPNNLPTQVTSFIGRAGDVERARQMLDGARLLTLTGPGGTGKTRLSLQVAASVTADFRDGVWFVPLASVEDPTLVGSAILDALGVRETADRPPEERVVQHLKDKHLLLVLDNFEQILPAAPLVGTLLREAPDIKVLVSSRAPLHVYGEQEFPVPPLGLPDPASATSIASVSQYEAVALFIQRCKAVKPSFEVTSANAPAIAEICARLDGLPLAIELAAARIKLLTPDAMLRRLEHRLSILSGGAADLPARQQTLHGAISWSYDLLDDTAKSVLRQLSVFVGGSTLEEAEAICVGEADVFEGIATLVDHSLVRQTETTEAVRFSMLETIREFAREELEAQGEAPAIRERHAKVFLALAETARPHLTGRDQVMWTDRLGDEHGNIRAALEYYIETNRIDEAARMAASLWRFWQKKHVHEGRQRVDAVLALSGSDLAPIELADLNEAAGGLAWWAGDVDSIEPHYRKALELQRAHGDAEGVANALYNMSFAYAVTGQDYDSARVLLDESLALYQAENDVAGQAKAFWGLGSSATFCKRDDLAEGAFVEALRLAREADEVFLIAWSLHMLGGVVLRRGDNAQARELLTEGLELFAGTQDVAAITMLLDDFANLSSAEGDEERATRLTAASNKMAQVSGSELIEISRERVGIASSTGESFSRAWAEGLAMTPEQAVSYALSR